ncbi:unnamed protein product [Orchesella dallaii]|uniref:CATSPERD/E C-terminal domain-containing protein n=1 Tax=Orchesella dallaii TaxID=48710 RepID=A0ABP1R9U5_9HEXA
MRWRSAGVHFPASLLLLVYLLTGYVAGFAFHRYHGPSEDRGIIPIDPTNSSLDYDVVTVDFYMRSYLTGPIDDHFVFLNKDTISAYVGPAPIGHPSPDGSSGGSTIRFWAIFNEKKNAKCYIQSVFNWGEVVVFICPTPGIYRVYAFDKKIKSVSELPRPIKAKDVDRNVWEWTSKQQTDAFDVLGGPGIDHFPSHPPSLTLYEKIQILLKQDGVVKSDPVAVKKSFYCYYWQYRLVERARVGYVGDEVVPAVGRNGSYILFDLIIWIAEPGAIPLEETEYDVSKLIVSAYSKILTTRFHSIGLFPCLRYAHNVIEIVKEIEFVDSFDQSNQFNSAPHWKAILKIHTDRIIATLSDIAFTVAARQNTASFGCFVGDTRGFISVRRFEFVKHQKVERTSINLENSDIWYREKKLIKHQIKHIYGHGVQYVGNEWSKIFQPGTVRPDMVIISNPCITQEFAFSVGGSLYVAEGMLEKGASQATQVHLLDFKFSEARFSDPRYFRYYIRVFDVAFTPTHLAVLLADGSIILHSTSISQKGIARMTNAEKYRPSGFVKRRWCASTSTKKMSNTMLPIFSRGGAIVILQLYPTEGHGSPVRMWVTPPSSSCLPEGVGFVSKARDASEVINETDIHYNEYVAVKRSNHKTGLKEDPLAPRPDPPSPPPVNFEEEKTFLLNRDKSRANDPHYPPELTNPAAKVLSQTSKNLNKAVIYVVEEDEEEMRRVLKENGITNIPATNDPAKDDLGLYTVEFTAVEKQFILAVKFKAVEIPSNFSSTGRADPFQMMITTATITNFPLRVKLPEDFRTQDENLDVIIPFPGIIILRSKPYSVPAVRSRDPIEQEEHKRELKGNKFVDYTPEIFTMSTAIPSYVIDFGDIFLYTSLESRYARPLHYYKWDTMDAKMNSGKPVAFEESSIKFTQPDRLYDAVVTEQGIISVLWRKKTRHLIQDDVECIKTAEGDTQTVAMGSVISLEGLREVKPFFRNDNVFQKATPDGEVIYGIYDVKPFSPFPGCRPHTTFDDTRHDLEVCIQQPDALGHHTKPPFRFCDPSVPAPCRDPGFIKDCLDGFSTTTGCLRSNNVSCSERYKDGNFIRPSEMNSSDPLQPSSCDPIEDSVTGCYPQHAPREELRSVHILGTPFLSYLIGSLKSVRTLHPEAPTPTATTTADDIDEPDVCPFASFNVHSTNFDFAEVGYKTRITGQISYLGRSIPTEADLIIEYDRSMGIVVEISASVQEERDLTTIRKTIDISFEMTDYTLAELNSTTDYLLESLDFDDMRAREKSIAFSVTLRPTIVNMVCKNTDFFKTVQFNVGCNAFSQIRLISEATPFKRINWTDVLDESKGNFKWWRDLSDPNNPNVSIPRAHIFPKQINGEFERQLCDNTRCVLPFFKLYQNEIFTVSYRDFVRPQFEQFLTVSSRRVSGNVVIYDLLGSKDFNLTMNQLKAGCYSNGGFWYDKLLNTTNYIGVGSTVHENVYKYYKDCFNSSDITNREQPFELHKTSFYLFNLTNHNRIKFKRQRNQMFIFRAVIVNTHFNRFTYCKLLDTFFMVRVAGIPIPRQGLALWHCLIVVLSVAGGFFLSYIFFYKFYTWKLDLGEVSIENRLDDQDETLSKQAWMIEDADLPVESDHLIATLAHRHRIPDNVKSVMRKPGDLDDTSSIKMKNALAYKADDGSATKTTS